jgi:hypothetical protein
LLDDHALLHHLLQRVLRELIDVIDVLNLLLWGDPFLLTLFRLT